MFSTLAAVCGAPVVLTGAVIGGVTTLVVVILGFLAYMWWFDNRRKPHRTYTQFGPLEANGSADYTTGDRP